MARKSFPKLSKEKPMAALSVMENRVMGPPNNAARAHRISVMSITAAQPMFLSLSILPGSMAASGPAIIGNKNAVVSNMCTPFYPNIEIPVRIRSVITQENSPRNRLQAVSTSMGRM